MQGGLFPYQAEVVEFIEEHNGGILWVDAGLGKSLMAITAVLNMFPGLTPPIKRLPPSPAQPGIVGSVQGSDGAVAETRGLILCSKKALNTWRREWDKWAPEVQAPIIIEGSPQQRARLWEEEGPLYVIAYQTAIRDLHHIKSKSWDFCIADECKNIRNHKTKTFKKLAPVLKKIEPKILMDASLTDRGVQELWGFLNLQEPGTFGSYWRFLNTFCVVEDGMFGKEILGPKNQQLLAETLLPRLVKIDEDDPRVASQRPPMLRDYIPLNMTSQQSKIYEELLEDSLSETSPDNWIVTKSILTKITKIRQLLVCPKILDRSLGYGAAIEHLLLELAEDPHTVIFTPYIKGVEYIKEAIEDSPTLGKKTEVLTLKGGTSSQEVGRVEKVFQEDKDTTCVCSVAFAESFELPSAKRAFFIGYDWSQSINYQAQKRLHRVTTPHPVNIYYYLHQNTIEDRILEILHNKVQNVKLTFQHYMQVIEENRTQDHDQNQ